MTLQQVAFDIETTGLTVRDTVTVVGFALPMGVRVFCRTDGHGTEGPPPDDLQAAVQDRVDTPIKLSTHESERRLLEAVGTFTRDRFGGDDWLLVAYNGETWNGGFDLPFLRTRLASHGLSWPFPDLPYADLVSLVRDRFNTRDDEGAAADLATAYETLCDGEYGSLDPFADSNEAVTTFESGAYADLVIHNVADVLRTAAVGRTAEQYCSRSDFSLKSLTPVADD